MVNRVQYGHKQPIHCLLKISRISIWNPLTIDSDFYERIVSRQSSLFSSKVGNMFPGWSMPWVPKHLFGKNIKGKTNSCFRTHDKPLVKDLNGVCDHGTSYISRKPSRSTSWRCVINHYQNFEIFYKQVCKNTDLVCYFSRILYQNEVVSILHKYFNQNRLFLFHLDQHVFEVWQL